MCVCVCDVELCWFDIPVLFYNFQSSKKVADGLLAKTGFAAGWWMEDLSPPARFPARRISSHGEHATVLLLQDMAWSWDLSLACAENTKTVITVLPSYYSWLIFYDLWFYTFSKVVNFRDSDLFQRVILHTCTTSRLILCLYIFIHGLKVSLLCLP